MDQEIIVDKKVKLRTIITLRGIKDEGNVKKVVVEKDFTRPIDDIDIAQFLSDNQNKGVTFAVTSVRNYLV